MMLRKLSTLLMFALYLLIESTSRSNSHSDRDVNVEAHGFQIFIVYHMMPNPNNRMGLLIFIQLLHDVSDLINVF